MIAPSTPPAKVGNKLLASLPLRSEERYILQISLSRISLAAGAFIFGREIDRVLFIEKGVVSPTIITGDGETLGIAPIGREGAVGLLGIVADDYAFQVRALTPVEALQISAAALEVACSRSKELENLLRNYSEELLRDSIRTLACHYHHELDKRLPQWLLTATERAGSQRLAVTQEIIAEAHGVGVSAISPVLEGMERRGLIQRARGQITVLNRVRLRSSACGCSHAAARGKKYVIKTRSL
jgi:CRP-like cAMP-binding protein